MSKLLKLGVKPEHCAGCVFYYSAGRKDPGSDVLRYNAWCCAKGDAASKSVGWCITHKKKTHAVSRDTVDVFPGPIARYAVLYKTFSWNGVMKAEWFLYKEYTDAAFDSFSGRPVSCYSKVGGQNFVLDTPDDVVEQVIRQVRIHNGDVRVDIIHEIGSDEAESLKLTVRK